MMQVAVEDTHDNYVICRGYDPRIKKFFDYVEGDPDKLGIPVAKPWSNRTAGAYTVGQIFPAVIPLTKIGQTPGVRDPGEDEEDPLLGQPADLDEEVGILYTDEAVEADRKVVNWLLLEGGGEGSTKFAKLDATLNAGSSCEASIWSGDPLADSGDNVTVNDWLLGGGESLASGTKVVIEFISGKWYVTQASCSV